jgi:calcium-translocating P-type ATPase
VSVSDPASGSEPAAPHALTAAEALQALATTVEGLPEDEVARRLAADGPNRLPSVPRPGPIRRFLEQFHSLLIYVLLAAAAISAALGEVVDAAVIGLVVLINAIVGFVQEGKAERALEAIRDMLAPTATVRRGGRRQEIPADRLVRGDAVILKTGDRVPADLRLLQADALEIQESALTGESLGVMKDPAPVAADAALADRSNMGYAGTLVTQGTGLGLVTATAGATELGRITGMIAEVDSLQTPLMRQLSSFAGVLTVIIVVMAVGMGLFGWLVQDYQPREMFMAAVALAVAAIPEGLPAIMTVALAIGVTRMVRRNAIIRQLPAVETLGAVSVICSDKTGTLTQNKLAVSELVTAEAVDTPGHRTHETALALLRAGLLCNDGEAEWHGGGWLYHGNPTDAAFLSAAVEAGFDPVEERASEPRRAVLPFDSRRKVMASAHFTQDRSGGDGAVYLKGAPERVLERCSHEAAGAETRAIDLAVWEQRLAELTARGRRVLAVARRFEAEAREGRLTEAEVEGGFTLLGLVGLIDPPREEAKTSVAQCHAAGIRVKMITGDHAATARAIGAELGIGDGRTALTGAEIDALPADALRQRVEDCDIFARTTPEHKIRLVEALQAQGRIVAMTGDGVNDAPALKRADIGTAMGRNGTEAAKEAADMVLADDNFASIAAAVEEGRTVYDNIRKAILFILPTSFGWSFVILAAVLAGQVLPVTPAQILWVNMIATVTLALAISFEPPEERVMDRAPRDPKAPLLDLFLLWRTLFVAALMVAASYGGFLVAQAYGAGLAEARTVAVTVLVLCDCGYLLNARRLSAGLFARGLWRGNPYLVPAIVMTVILQAGFAYLPPLQAMFGTAPLSAAAWGAAFGAALLLALAVEAERRIMRRLRG